MDGLDYFRNLCKERLPLFEIALMLVCLDRIPNVIINANHSVM